MGVSEQRYSSHLIRILSIILLSLSCPRTIAVESASGRKDPATAAGLPPAMDTFLSALLDTANLHDPHSIEYPGYKPDARHVQVVRFSTLIAEIIRVYGSAQNYKGPPIRSLPEYVQKREPTRSNTGSLRTDMDFIIDQSGGAHRLSPAAVVGLDQFADNGTRVEAEFFELDRANGLLRILQGTPGLSGLSPTMVGSILTGVVGVFIGSRSSVHYMRGLADQLKDAPDKKPEAAQPGSPAVAALEGPKEGKLALEPSSPTKGEGGRKPGLAAKNPADGNSKLVHGPPDPKPNVPATMAPSPAATNTPTLMGGLLTASTAALMLSRGADTVEQFHQIGESEEGFLDFLEKIDKSPTADRLRLMEESHRKLREVGLPLLYNIAELAGHSPEIKGLAEFEDERIYGLLQVFFGDYLRMLPSPIKKEILRDIFRSSFETTDYQAMTIIVTHYWPIAQQFFQTVSTMGGLKSFAKMFKRIRDRGEEVPLSVVERVIQEDPNQYPLTNIRLSGKAGKLFQLVYADYTDKAGNVTPVAVRVLKPNMGINLDLERLILRRLAGRLSEVLRKKDKSGPSERRLLELIDMIYRNLKQELRVDLTVQNQNAAARRLSRKLKIKTELHGEAFLNIKVPLAFPAKPGSKVMVMERVKDILPQEEVEQHHPELPLQFSAALMDTTFRELLIRPMETVLDSTPVEEGDSHPGEGFMHGDLHSGNYLFGTPEETEQGLEYTVNIIDYGTVAFVKAEHVQELVQLTVGASYNSAPFILEALWSLRDPKMDEDWAQTPHLLERARKELAVAVYHKASELRRTGAFWSTADWVTFIWEQELIDFPSWLITLEQGFRAVRTSYLEMGRSLKQLHDQETAFAAEHTPLFYRYMKKKVGRHKGWRGVYAFEANRCIRRLLGKAN